MPPTFRSGSRVATCAAALLLIAAGCSGGAAVDSSPSSSPTAARPATPTPTRKPTFSPVPSQSPSPPIPTPAPSASAIETLKIGSPYVLVFNPANTALSATFSFQMASVNVTETMSGREIHQRAKLVGLAYVIEFIGIPMNDAAFEGGARGAAANTGGKVTKSASFALYLHDDAIVMVGAQTLSLTKTLLTSVIKAND
jgi:hypothetical protein